RSHWLQGAVRSGPRASSRPGAGNPSSGSLPPDSTQSRASLSKGPIMKRIGVDVGGTFTDLYFSDDEQRTAVVEKVPSTPHDPSEAVVNGIRKLCEKAGVALSEIDQLVHGTTVATNTALTHTGAEVGMITTEGFRDILHIARHKKPHNFSLQQDL